MKYISMEVLENIAEELAHKFGALYDHYYETSSKRTRESYDRKMCDINAQLALIRELRSMKEQKDEWFIYLNVRRNNLLEDAHNFVRDYLAEQKDCDPDDIPDEELDGVDYDYLIERYEYLEDCNVAFNDTWQFIVEDYFREV